MRVIGPEPEKDRELREWFDDQAKRNLERLEEGAKTIIQLVTGLYGVLFAVLALSDQPPYLQQPGVQMWGTASLVTLFLALFAALVTVFPWRYEYQQDNLTKMHQVFRSMHRVKSWSLWIALVLFLIGTACLGIVIGIVLWSF
ncbi:MAG: hypothetical protein HC914_18010 [Chloroflexaceae bacterium]|nr:hypothetical protein [Chloroflexaceae bacterium]